ncbi:MAG: flippase-like domain-containing protein [Deltaproteobacteria bacterium]|jgi:uncharacterized protein (TIRG00374 family)|nr:flippase-like domain-containing protein [Deltaproteobacteria bacterium]
MNNKLTLSLIAGIVISAIALYLAFRNVPFPELIGYFATINYVWALPSIIIVVLCFFIRALRWRIILESSRKISLMRAYHPMIIGFMMNCVLPGRVGELARPVIIKKKENIPFATGLATVAAERVFDICFLVLFLVITFSVVKIDPDIKMKFGTYELSRETLTAIFGGMVKLGILLIAGIALISINKIQQLVNRLIMKLPDLFFFTGRQFRAALSDKFCRPLTGFVENIARGFHLIRYPKKLLVCLVLSFLVWGMHALSYYMLSLGSPDIDLTFMEMSAHMVILMFIIALPSVPGFWGLWEAGGIFALSLFGIATKDAAGFTLVNHAIQVFPIIIMGFVSAMIISVNILQLSRNSKTIEDVDSNIDPKI